MLYKSHMNGPRRGTSYFNQRDDGTTCIKLTNIETNMHDIEHYELVLSLQYIPRIKHMIIPWLMIL